MPWLVVLFGLMIAPLGITSIFFVIIQPIVIGTLSTVALIGAAAILIQIPYSLDELIATLMATPFLFTGDTTATLVSVLAGAALMALSVRRGPIRERYGAWDMGDQFLILILI